MEAVNDGADFAIVKLSCDCGDVGVVVEAHASVKTSSPKVP